MSKDAGFWVWSFRVWGLRVWALASFRFRVQGLGLLVLSARGWNFNPAVVPVAVVKNSSAAPKTPLKSMMQRQQEGRGRVLVLLRRLVCMSTHADFEAVAENQAARAFAACMLFYMPLHMCSSG